ncbi:MAG TPA: hypothetical protein PKI61_04235 [bacterium]|nr:hypothetical protein [bacterium]HPT29615.1 hypothetical protein [bacterium]
MALTSSLALEKVDSRTWVWSLLLAFTAAAAPFFIHNQWITGPLVNAVLIIVLFLSGWRLAALVAFVPSLMALSGGLLLPIMAPLVPVIILSNLVFISTINYLYYRLKGNEPYWPAVVSGALFKFAFLFVVAKAVVKFLNEPRLETLVNAMMSWPQLFSALLGGIIAFFILKWLRRI